MPSSSSKVTNYEDVARLSPLGYEHINILGQSRFHLSEDLQRGSMRSLRNSEPLGKFNNLLI